MREQLQSQLQLQLRPAAGRVQKVVVRDKTMGGSMGEPVGMVLGSHMTLRRTYTALASLHHPTLTPASCGQRPPQGPRAPVGAESTRHTSKEHVTAGVL